ncbi:AI-2E family transporter [Clostridium sp. JN-9]|uniref:AI-2E family transporter n=1 Tax=Clostridium sp. JN-9 TaxID=2507159 RepID=UPI000FFE1446|nr:AI-2E family transporter [Clostridium sp. JN-9]QAT39706.1 AI-2E family transporter [Clostridium sp. JN-9]
MNLDKKLLKYCLYAAATIILSYIGISVFNNLGSIFNLLFNTLGTIANLVKPLIIALIIAYLLKPGVRFIENFLETRKIFKKPASRRTIGILIMYALIISIFIAILSGIYIMIGGKLSNNVTISAMTGYLSNYLNNSALSVSSISDKLKSLNISIPGNLNEKLAEIISNIQTYFSASIVSLTSSVVSLLSNIALFLISLVLSIYLLQDSEYFLNLWNKIFALVFRESKTGAKLKEIFNIIDDTFSNYIRGQLLEASMVGILSAIVLFFIGIDYAVMIGIIAGICNMIPYIGPMVGTVLAVVMALLSGQPITAIWAVIGMLAVQQVDNNLLAPKIVGDSVGLHPVFTMLAILIGGNAGGLIGMLIAVPAAASLKILLSKWYNYHLEKSSD